MIEQCPRMGCLTGERVLVFGGSGSLGTTVVKRWFGTNDIINVSRNEEKQWALRQCVGMSSRLTQIIGDITRPEDVSRALRISRPTVVCVFSCMKHVELCEQSPMKAMDTNARGIMNIYDALLHWTENTVKTVLYVSTDKACLPITTYGCTKALAEFFIQGIPKSTTKWISIRYGNVLGSSGSILPYLQSHKHTDSPYTLTHPDMTRFLMTLDHSVNLIEYAIEHGKHNEIIIPRIYSMRISDLFNLFADLYGKKIEVTGLRCKEKIHEDLLSPSEAQCAVDCGPYIHISPTIFTHSPYVTPYDSSSTLISKDTLKNYLSSLNYL
jgi:UDP-glucose 4-epimerase